MTSTSERRWICVIDKERCKHDHWRRSQPDWKGEPLRGHDLCGWVDMPVPADKTFASDTTEAR